MLSEEDNNKCNLPIKCRRAHNNKNSYNKLNTCNFLIKYNTILNIYIYNLSVL